MTRALTLTVNGSTVEVEARPRHPAARRAARRARAARVAVRLRHGPVRRLLRADGRRRGAVLRHPAVVGRGHRGGHRRGPRRRRPPHPVQQALLDEQAAQCGFCISGIAVAAAALLERDPHPDEAAVVEALDRNLCRCGAHGRIVAGGRAGGGGRVVTADGPPVLPRHLAANPLLSRWVAVARRRHGRRTRREGGARSGHPHRARPGGRRRARPAPGPGPDAARAHRARPRPGPDGGQHVRARHRPRAAGRRRAPAGAARRRGGRPVGGAGRAGHRRGRDARRPCSGASFVRIAVVGARIKQAAIQGAEARDRRPAAHRAGRLRAAPPRHPARAPTPRS